MKRLPTDCGWIVFAIGLVTILAACTTKNVESTTTSNLPAAAAPLQGFSKSPADETVKAPEPMVAAKTEPKAAAEAVKRDVGNIYFAFDHWGLTTEGKKSLGEDAELLKRNPRAALVIEGYCDERGSREYNLVLGDKRAQEAMRYLTALGIQNAVKVISYGEERPVCREHEEACYWKNRRAHLLIEDGK